MIRAIVREVRDLDKDVSALLAPFEASGSSFSPTAEPATACSVLVNHLCMRRNKRCLLAYHRVRAERLEALAWAGEDVFGGAGSELGGQDDGERGGKGAAGLGSEAGNQLCLGAEERNQQICWRLKKASVPISI